MDIAAAVVLAAEPLSAILFAHQQPSPETCFEVFGMDFLVDRNFRSCLLEANTCPSPGCAADMDRAVKYRMLSDLLPMVEPPSGHMRQQLRHAKRGCRGGRPPPRCGGRSTCNGYQALCVKGYSRAWEVLDGRQSCPVACLPLAWEWVPRGGGRMRRGGVGRLLLRV